MHFIRSFTGLIVTSSFLIFLASCSMDTKTVEPFLLKVDSLHVLDTVTSRTLFEINIFGTVGPSGCYAYEKTYLYPGIDNEIIMEVWGRYTYVGIDCKQGVVYFNEAIETTLPAAGDYTLKILRPDNSFLERKITAI